MVDDSCIVSGVHGWLRVYGCCNAAAISRVFGKCLLANDGMPNKCRVSVSIHLGGLRWPLN